jgi:hypothetical protein
MLGVVGTVPDLKVPLIHGVVGIVDGHLAVAGYRIPVNRGTPALLAAAVKAGESLNSPGIYALMATTLAVAIFG